METTRREPVRLTRNVCPLGYLVGKVHTLSETLYFQFDGKTETVNLPVANVYPGLLSVAENCPTT